MSEQESTGAMPAAAPTIYPALGYRDARAAISWLCEAFGFEELMVHPGEDRREVAHAELGFGSGILMLGSQRDGAPGAGDVALEASSSGDIDFSRVPFSIYVAVSDVDDHCERARAAGAEIAREPADTPYGSREYACRDLEGNAWSFGTYRPTAAG